MEGHTCSTRCELCVLFPEKYSTPSGDSVLNCTVIFWFWGSKYLLSQVVKLYKIQVLPSKTNFLPPSSMKK